MVIPPATDMIDLLYLCLFTAVLGNMFRLVVMLHLSTVFMSYCFFYIWKWFTLVYGLNTFFFTFCRPFCLRNILPNLK